MDIKYKIYDFLKYADNQLNQFDLIKLSFTIVIIHTFILYTYLYYSGKLIRYFAKFKNDKEFINIGLENMSIAIVEQSFFPVYMRLALIRIFGNKKLARFFSCISLTSSHVFMFNLFYELPTIILQIMLSFILSLIYTKMDILDAFILNMLINIFGVLITYIFWKFIFKTHFFQAKTFITPIIVDSTIINSGIGVGIESGSIKID